MGCRSFFIHKKYEKKQRIRGMGEREKKEVKKELFI